MDEWINHKGILFIHEKELNIAICDNTDGPRWHQRIMLGGTSQPYDFSYIWNLKKPQNSKPKNKLINIENRLVFVSSERWKVVEISKMCCFILFYINSVIFLNAIFSRKGIRKKRNLAVFFVFVFVLYFSLVWIFVIGKEKK